MSSHQISFQMLFQSANLYIFAYKAARINHPAYKYQKLDFGYIKEGKI